MGDQQNTKKSDEPITKKVKDRLRKYTDKLRNIDNQYARLDRLETKMQSPAGPDLSGMPRGSGSHTDRTAMMVMRKMELDEEIAAAIEEEKAERKAIDAMICELEEPDEQAVLRLRYFDQADWGDVTFALYGDRPDYIERMEAYRRRTYRIHGRALLNMAEILEESEVNDTKVVQNGSQ